MGTNPSLMSYNPTHHTQGFEPSKTPGILIAEDVRALALNRRVFPRLRFDAKTDVPQGYTMQKIVTLGPMEIPGHPLIPSATPSDAHFTRHFITTLQTSTGDCPDFRVSENGRLPSRWRIIGQVDRQAGGVNVAGGEDGEIARRHRE